MDKNPTDDFNLGGPSTDIVDIFVMFLLGRDAWEKALRGDESVRRDVAGAYALANLMAEERTKYIRVAEPAQARVK